MYTKEEFENYYLCKSLEKQVKALRIEIADFEKTSEDSGRFFFAKLLTAVKRPDICARIDQTLRLHPEYRRSGDLIYRGQKADTVSFANENYPDAAKKCFTTILNMTSSDAIDPAFAARLFACYNTLLLMIKRQGEVVSGFTKGKLTEKKARLEKNEKQLEELKKSGADIIDDSDNGVSAREGRIFYGYKKAEYFPEQIKLANENGIHLITKYPEYVEFSGKQSNLFLRCGSADRDPKKIYSFVKTLYFKNLLAYPPSMIKFAFIERKAIGAENGISIFDAHLKNDICKDVPEFDYGVFTASPGLNQTVSGDATRVTVADSPDAVKKLLKSIDDEVDSRKKTYINGTSSAYCSLLEYNARNKYNQLPYIVLVIDSIPEEFYVKERMYGGNEIIKKLENIIKCGGAVGVSLIFVGEDNPMPCDSSGDDNWSFGNVGDYFKTFDFSDRERVYEDYCDEDAIVSSYVQAKKNAQKLSINTIIDRVGDFEKPPEGQEIKVPVGLCDGEVYYFDATSNGEDSELKGGAHSLVLGKTARGKTSFIHTLIMTASYYYSPDEVQFYLLDFKSQQGSTDYGRYEQGAYSYVPHIKFISAKGNVKQAYDVTEMIENLIARRTKMLRDKNFTDYCKARRSDPTMRPVPYVFFIIDEYNAIFNDNAFELKERLESFLSRCRSVGIYIILSGQKITVNLGNIDNRIIYDSDEFLKGINTSSKGVGSTANEYFSIDSLYENRIKEKVGYAVFVKPDETNTFPVVRVAFSNADECGKLAETIREKYKGYARIQIKAGSEKAESADSFLAYEDDEESDLNEIDNDEYSFYVGVSSLSSRPRAVRFGKTANASGDSGRFHHNCVVVSDEEKQAKIERAVMFGFLRFALKNGQLYEVADRRVSYCYFGDWAKYRKENVSAEKTAEMLRKKNISDLINVRTTQDGVIREIEIFYSTYVSRKNSDVRIEVENTPYLLVLHNCFWIPLLKSMQDAAAAEDASRYDETSPEEMCRYLAEQTGLSYEIIKENLFDDPEALKQNYLEAKEGNGERSEPATGEPLPDKSTVIDHLKELMENGGAQNVFVILCTDNYSEYRDIRFISVDRWQNAVFGQQKSTTGKNSGNEFDAVQAEEDICYVDNIPVRLFDYDNADKWWENFDEIRGKTNG